MRMIRFPVHFKQSYPCPNSPSGDGQADEQNVEIEAKARCGFVRYGWCFL